MDYGNDDEKWVDMKVHDQEEETAEEDKEKKESIEKRVKDINVKEHVDALMNGEGDLSEEFKKTATVFEACSKIKSA